MAKEILHNVQRCPRTEIGSYLDGELSPTAEIELEKHLATCPPCLDELNNQKEMLLALDFAFDRADEIELPKDFTRVVVAKAESGVRGLRSKKERSRALFLSLGLFSLIILGLGAEAGQAFGNLSGFGRHVLAILGFIIHLALDITTGAVVILRSICQQVIYSQMFLGLLFVGLFVIFALTLSHFGGKFKRF